MSTSYFIKGNPITVSDLLKMKEIVKDLEIETDISQSKEERLEITTLSKLNPNETHRLRIKKYNRDYDQTNYFWVYVDENHQISSFCRYGNNIVGEIIRLIEFYCDTTLIDEYVYMEFIDLKLQNTVTVFYQTESERLDGELFLKSLNKEVEFIKVEPKNFRLESSDIDSLMDLGKGVWFKSIDQFGSKSEILSKFSTYFGSPNFSDEFDIYEDKNLIVNECEVLG